MTAPFPGMTMPMPGAAPAMAAPQTGFVLQIPADPAWEPFDSLDVLEKDGYYCCKIIKEAARNDSNKSPGVFMTLEVQDEDAKGKLLSRFLPDPRTAKGNVYFIWRGLFRSITGDLGLARQGITYTPGMMNGQLVFVKTERAMRDDRLSTDVDTWITRDEYTKAVQANSHRWAPKAVATGTGNTVGVLPGGAPAGFPGMPGGPGGGFPLGGGLPGAPSPAVPMATGPVTTPQPTGAPMQAAPAAAPAPVFPGMGAPPPAAVAPPQAAPAMAFPGMAPPAAAPAAAPFAPPAVLNPATPPAAASGMPAPVAPGATFSFAQFPGQPAAPGVNGAVPPTAAGLVSSFPGQPPQQ